MSESIIPAGAVKPSLQLVRLPVEKSQSAVNFLRERSGGVMDMIAHFWERLAHTPPLQRRDLHLLAAIPNESLNININIDIISSQQFSGAMLYVPKAHRADVLATDQSTAAAFATYIAHYGLKNLRNDLEDPGRATVNEPSRSETTAENGAVKREINHLAGFEENVAVPPHSMLSLLDISGGGRPGNAEIIKFPEVPAQAKSTSNDRIPIDFLTGDVNGIEWMTPLLLPLVHKRAPARKLVNAMMQLPATAEASPEPNVRLAREADIPVLNRWRRQYKEERGIHFDADMDAWIENQRVFVYELAQGIKSDDNESPIESTGGGAVTIVAVAKIDLELHLLAEIGGVYTFPEYRKKGYGAAIVRDLAWRIRQSGKMPTLQVDEQNLPALHLYESAGWRTMGRLARVWLTG